MVIDASDFLKTSARTAEDYLSQIVPSGSEEPVALHRAMRHSLLGGGKRLRFGLVLASAEAAGLTEATRALPVAAALEMIHAYSLIHDDLPCMDDDDFRRGRPTCHRVFGEAMAVLAGDALLTLAFAHLGEAAMRGEIPAAALPRLLAVIGGAAGTPEGMVAGQAADIEAEAGVASAEVLEFIHERKTGALIEAACVAGGLLAEAQQRVIAALSAYGRALGHAFQIVDDILDVTQTTEALGKTAGKDAAQHKVTYPGVHGLEEAKRMAAQQADVARTALSELGSRGDLLRALVDFVVQRKH